MSTEVAIEHAGTREVTRQVVRESPAEVGDALRATTTGRVVLTGETGERVELERRLVMWYRRMA